MSIRRTPLHDEHARLGAKIVPFGGWDMPLSYTGVLAEHKAVRESAGLFDVSHLGKLEITEEAGEALDRFLPGKVAKLAPWTAGYNLVLNESGGIVDDIFVYRTPKSYLLVPNASNTDAVIEALATAGIQSMDQRPDWAIIALSGPRAREIIVEIAPESAGQKLHTVVETRIADARCLIARTGYTGEFTAELIVPSGDAVNIWNILLENPDVTPAGLGARDTLRLEMGYPLHGHEISEETNPIEAELGWAIDWQKEFATKPLLEELKSSGTPRKLVGLVSRGREIPRTGYAVSSNGETVGAVTSGNFSPVLGKGIALAYVNTEVSEPGTILAVDVRGRPLEAEVTKPPFIKS
ncbi:MAG TPA: glycine cleavage system aminomethyltransferase GcvT [Actinomycetota bacterium]|nr:glycine cleavage system aminomethyltransferase GcvT [Actinomycetota bacterium]